MANKYIIEGATYNGDGTSSAEATSNGGVGAWNTITYFEGAAPAYGSISAGDEIYIRSKTAAGANITRTLTANASIGSTAGTNALPVKWYIDNGSIWPGASGTLTYQCPSSFFITQVENNHVIAMTKNALVFLEQSDTFYGSKITYAILSPGLIEKAYFDFSFASFTGSCVQIKNTTGYTTFKDVYIKSATKAMWTMYINQGGVVAQFFNLEIELTNSANTSPTFLVGEYGQSLAEVFGGRVFGAGATTGTSVVRLLNGSSFNSVGFKYPTAMIFSTTQPTFPSIGSAFGPDGEVAASFVDTWGFADSRADGYYPTLNAFLPNSAQSPWAWKLLPKWASAIRPMKLNVAKIYTENPAIKTITLEMLVPNSNTTAKRNTLWIDVVYVDAATGATRLLSSKLNAASSLDASSASWTTTTYGPTLFDKKRLQVVTPTTIKKDSVVSVMLRGEYASASDNDVLFVCPDVTLT